MNACTACAFCAIYILHGVLRVNFYYDKFFTRHSLSPFLGFSFRFVCSFFHSFVCFLVYIWCWKRAKMASMPIFNTWKLIFIFYMQSVRLFFFFEKLNKCLYLLCHWHTLHFDINRNYRNNSNSNDCHLAFEFTIQWKWIWYI